MFMNDRGLRYVAPPSGDSPKVLANLSALVTAIRDSPLLEVGNTHTDPCCFVLALSVVYIFCA